MFSLMLFSVFSGISNAEDSNAKVDQPLVVDSGVGLITEYRSNLYLESGEAFGGDEAVGGASVLLNPHFKLKFKGNNLNANLGLNYFARKYLNESYANLDRYSNGRGLIGLQINPNGKVGFDIQDMLDSTGRESSADTAQTAYIQKVNNALRSGIAFHPGSALDIKIGGLFNTENIVGADSSSANPGSQNDRLGYGGYLAVLWTFLPKTSVFLDTEYEQFDWSKNVICQTIDGSCGGVLAEGYLGIPNGNTFRAKTGLSGQITEKLLLKLSFGYGMSDYDEDSVASNANGGIAQYLTQTTAVDVEGLDGLMIDAALQVAPSDKQFFSLAYTRNFMDVYFTNFSIYHQFMLTHGWEMGTVAELNTSIKYRFDDYDGTVDRSDHRLSATSDFNLNFTPSLSMNIGGAWKRLASADGYSNIEYDDYNIHTGLIFKK